MLSYNAPEMNRTREIADTREKGLKRYRLYKSVLERYKEAQNSGFYLEAITLMESLITDRLESILIYYNQLSPEKAFLTLGACLTALKNVQGILSDELIIQLNNWRMARNQSLHEIAKIEEDDSALFNQRYVRLQQIAKDGYKLFKLIKEEAK